MRATLEIKPKYYEAAQLRSCLLRPKERLRGRSYVQLDEEYISHVDTVRDNTCVTV